jgi:hypothetical protein
LVLAGMMAVGTLMRRWLCVRDRCDVSPCSTRKRRPTQARPRQVAPPLYPTEFKQSLDKNS